ncbi:MAG: hypothetical protein ACRD96_04760 [Bryobacteraceae bacterium]
MALPETVRVKLSSEEAGSVSLTPVVVRQIPVRELVEYALGVVGKDAARIRELLLRGTLVSGASRFRWTGWDAEPAGLDELLATFPDADPARPFARERCVRAVLRGPVRSIDVPRQIGEKKPLLRRSTFWDALMSAVAGTRYHSYSYRDRADRFTAAADAAMRERIREAARLIAYTTLRDQVQSTLVESVELLVER